MVSVMFGLVSHIVVPETLAEFIFKNAFFELGYSDPYLVLFFDQMHFNHRGL